MREDRPKCRICGVNPVCTTGNKRKDGTYYLSRRCWSCRGKRTALERFEEKYKKTDSGCWEWTAGLDSHGYGKFGAGGSGSSIFAHRWSYEHFIGPIPDGYFICHTCDNPKCVNPKHLYAGTHKDNMADMVERKRSTYGERNPNAVMDEEGVSLMRALYSQGETAHKLAKRFGVSRATAKIIVNRETWKHLR